MPHWVVTLLAEDLGSNVSRTGRAGRHDDRNIGAVRAGGGLERSATVRHQTGPCLAGLKRRAGTGAEGRPGRSANGRHDDLPERPIDAKALWPATCLVAHGPHAQQNNLSFEVTPFERG